MGRGPSAVGKGWLSYRDLAPNRLYEIHWVFAVGAHFCKLEIEHTQWSVKRKTTSQLGVDAKPLGANEGKQKVCVGSKHIHTTVYKIDNL